MGKVLISDKIRKQIMPMKCKQSKNPNKRTKRKQVRSANYKSATTTIRKGVGSSTDVIAQA